VEVNIFKSKVIFTSLFKDKVKGFVTLLLKMEEKYMKNISKWLLVA
jgi:hypothetical protein